MKTPTTFIEQVNIIILDHIEEPKLMPILTIKLHLSASQIGRKIKKATGQSATLYIRQFRLKVAHQWIIESDFTLLEIAHLVGFNQLAYFSRCFSEYYGYTPSSLRK